MKLVTRYFGIFHAFLALFEVLEHSLILKKHKQNTFQKFQASKKSKMQDAYVKTDTHIINVNITSNVNSFTSERKFDKGITVQTLKDKLELITGARSGIMTIEAFDQNDVKICDLKVIKMLRILIRCGF